MQGRDSTTFCDYLKGLPDELLELVTEDYIWLSGLAFEGEPAAEFHRRMECCRAECARRGAPQLYWMAEEVISPRAA